MASRQGLAGRAGAAFRDSLRRVKSGATALGPRETAVEVVRVFRDHGLLIQASAIAFRVLLCLVPLLLFGFALLGFLQLDEVWRQDLVPELRPSLSHPAFRLIDEAITNVLEEKTLFWVTVGAVITVWEGSGVVRAATHVLNAIYDVREQRSETRRFLASIAIAAAVIVLILLALALARLGPQLDDALGGGAAVEVVGAAVGWLGAVLALLAAVAIVVRSAPDIDRALGWVSFGALVVVGSWIVTSALFGFYLTEIASYQSVFGHLATVFILFEYLFLVSAAFIAGLVIDSLVEEAA